MQSVIKGILFTILLGFFTVAVAHEVSADICTFSGGITAYRVSDKGDWFPAIVKCDEKTIRVYAQKTNLLVAQFGMDDTVKVGMHRETGAWRKLFHDLGLAGITFGVYALCAVLDEQDGWEFLESPYAKSTISAGITLVSKGVFPERVLLRENTHFVMKDKSGETLHVRVDNGKEQEFYCKIRDRINMLPIQSLSEKRRISPLSFGISYPRRQAFVKAVLRF